VQRNVGVFSIFTLPTTALLFLDSIVATSKTPTRVHRQGKFIDGLTLKG
jgi:hypothetical protein